MDFNKFVSIIRNVFDISDVYNNANKFKYNKAKGIKL